MVSTADLNSTHVYNVTNGRVYDIIQAINTSEIHNYDDANNLCGAKGGTLVSLDSELKASAVKDLIAKHLERFGIQSSKYLIGKASTSSFG